MDPIDQRLHAEIRGSEPSAFEPRPDRLADGTCIHFERQDALWANRRLDLLVIEQRCGTAEAAILSSATGVKDRNGLAALALDGALFRQPAAGFVGKLAQRLDQVMFDERPSGLVDVERCGGAAEAAHEHLPRRVPLRLRTTGGTRIFLECRDGPRVHLLRQVLVQRRALDAVGRADLLGGELAGLDDRHHVGLGHAERLRNIGGAEKVRQHHRVRRRNL